MAEHPNPSADSRERLVLAHSRAITYYRRQLYAPAGTAARMLLRSRGLGDVLGASSPWAVGYAPAEWNGVTRYLQGQGFNEQELVASGISFRSAQGRVLDRFRDRLLFAVRNPVGEPVGFVGRAMKDPTNEDPKYLNSPATEIFTKKEILFGLAEQRESLSADSRVMVVEGPFDALSIAITAAAKGEYVGLATCGTALSREHLQTIKHLPGHLGFGFDGDDAGDRAAERAGALAREILPRRPIVGVAFPRDQDPSEILEHQGTSGLRTLLDGGALPLDHLLLTRRAANLLGDGGPDALSSPGRLALARSIAEEAVDLYRSLPEPALTFRLSRQLGVGAETMGALLAAAASTRVWPARPPTLGTTTIAAAAVAHSTVAPAPGAGHLPPAPWQQRPASTAHRAPTR